MVKGEHPYFFLRFGLRGAIVDRKYFHVANMSEERKSEFEKWYLERAKEKYIFRNEIYYYCTKDVEILRKGCVKFSNMIGDLTGIHPVLLHARDYDR